MSLSEYFHKPYSLCPEEFVCAPIYSEMCTEICTNIPEFCCCSWCILTRCLLCVWSVMREFLELLMSYLSIISFLQILLLTNSFILGGSGVASEYKAVNLIFLECGLLGIIQVMLWSSSGWTESKQKNETDKRSKNNERKNTKKQAKTKWQQTH